MTKNQAYALVTIVWIFGGSLVSGLAHASEDSAGTSDYSVGG